MKIVASGLVLKSGQEPRLKLHDFLKTFLLEVGDLAYLTGKATLC